MSIAISQIRQEQNMIKADLIFRIKYLFAEDMIVRPELLEALHHMNKVDQALEKWETPPNV